MTPRLIIAILSPMNDTAKILMESQFEGTCAVCQRTIAIRDTIVFFVENGFAVHEDCDRTDNNVPRIDAAELLRVDAREKRGRHIAETVRIKRKGDQYVVPSQTRGTRGSVYLVDLTAENGPTCTCLDHEERGHRCKHIHAVEYAIIMEQTADEDGAPVTTITRVSRVTYKQNWPVYNAAQTSERDHFVRLLRGLCEGVMQPRQSTGRPRHHLADVIFSLVWRAYSEKSLRRMMSELREFRDRGIIETAPHFNTLSDYDNRAEITPVLKVLIEESTLPLRDVETSFAVDSTGFTTSRFGRWFDEKWGRERSGREWVKCHASVGVKTHIVSAVEITRGYGSDTSDSRQFPGLLQTTAANFDVKEVSADKAYLSKDNLAAVVAVGGVPYVPFKSNSTGGTGATLWNKLFHFYQFKRDEFLAHYHKRSNVETAFSMIKGKFGGHVRSKTNRAQENEVLCKILAHNLCCLVMSMHELGIDPKFWTPQALPATGA